VAGLTLPFLGKPPHVDDPNFLALARGARLDPWRPHDILINWQGTTERAFDVLSNPPGNAWWLAPVVHAPDPVRHLWMLPWLLPVLWGAWRLGRRFANQGDAGLLLLLASPIVLLAAHGLTPDLPLLGCVLAGIAGFIDAVDRGRRAWGWALLAGCGFLFRYSGIAILPLLFLYLVLQRRSPWAALAALAPAALLFAHDGLAYGAIHFLAMTGFQSTSEGTRDLFRKGLAAVAMLGGAGLLPVLAWRAWPGMLMGAAAGSVGAWMSVQAPAAALTTVLFAAAGGAVLWGTIPRTSRDRDAWFLAAWTWGGFAFLLGLRFMAARYWLPFLLPVILAWLARRPSARLVATAVGVQAAVGLGCALDDLLQARAEVDLANRVADVAGSPGVFAGHWGWQEVLEARGWKAVQDDEVLPAGTLFASASNPWPQEPLVSDGSDVLWAGSVPGTELLPRLLAPAAGANIHAFLVAGAPPAETYAPWTLSWEPREHARLVRVGESR